MSLEAPTKLEKAVAWLKKPDKLKLVAIGIGLLVLLGLILFGVQQCSTGWSNYQIRKQKEAANAKIAEIKEVDAQIANLQLKKAEKVGEATVLIEEVKQAEIVANNAVNATDKAKENLNTAGQSNVDVTGADLERMLKEVK